MDHESIGVVYLARGVAPAYGTTDTNNTWEGRFQRFADSWRLHKPGTACTLYIVYRQGNLKASQAFFKDIPHVPLTAHFHENPYWGAAYIYAAQLMWEDHICVLNTSSDIRCDDWLKKMADVYFQPGVGLVGASGSFHSGVFQDTLPYPNTHIRGATFLLGCDDFVRIGSQFDFAGADPAWAGKAGGLAMEHGPNSLTKQIIASGRKVLVVGCDGIGLEPQNWPHPTTYADKANILVWDVSALRD